MKYNTSLLLLILTYFNIYYCSKTHLKSRNRDKANKNNISGLKTSSLLKNGPLASDYYRDIDSLLKGNYNNYEPSSRNYNTYNNLQNSYPGVNYNQPNLGGTYVDMFNSELNKQNIYSKADPLIDTKSIKENLPTFLGGSVPLSNNQKSKTFRPVGPDVDTTVDYKGRKYSNVYTLNTKNNVRSGYYGETRQT